MRMVPEYRYFHEYAAYEICLCAAFSDAIQIIDSMVI